jgi:hypothetical protein
MCKGNVTLRELSVQTGEFVNLLADLRLLFATTFMHRIT